MALQTTTTIKIGETVIANFTDLKINQKIHKHHTFSLVIGQDLMESEFNSAMPATQDLMGQKISIEIKPIPDFDDLMIIANPADYIMQFCGIITKVKMRKSTIEDMEEAIVIKGYSDSIVLDNGSESNSFTRLSLRDIVNKVKSGHNIDMDVHPLKDGVLAYTVQYNESDFDFLNRIAMRHGEWFYHNGVKMVFGSSGGRVTPKLIYGVNLQDFRYDIKLVPTLFKTLENDNRTGESFSDTTAKYTSESNAFHQAYINKSNQVFNKETVMQINQNAVGGSGSSASQEYTKNKMRSIMSGMMQIKAISEVPGITLGNTVNITGVDSQLETGYTVTQITHSCDDGGGYENHFTAVNFSGAAFSPKTNPDLFPLCQSQSAVVISNHDPDGLSGVMVQMPWQKAKGLTTPFIPMMQIYGGNGKGVHILPEVGEKVFVDFQGGNAEMPIVTGTMPNIKEKSGYSTPDNDIKAMHSRSNNRFVMNDKAGSMLLQDSSKSFIEMDGNRKMEINTDVLVLNVKKLIINASQSTEITTNDYILNALSQIYVFSRAMKQNIQGLMSLYSSKALINSDGAIDIEAKTTKLHGREKALVHSDKQAVINSKGTAKMHGTNGNSFTNTAKEVTASATDSIALAVVYFRPLDTWKGEFGFDWLREKDNGLSKEPDYQSIIEGGYKDGKDDLNKIQAYAQLKVEYENITIARKVPTATSITEYFVPYLTLFSKEFVDTMPANTTLKPKYEAELKILLDIEVEELDQLKFDYDDTLFEIDCPVLAQKTKTSGLVDRRDTIKIKCLKDLDSDKEITIYAYPKDSVTADANNTPSQGIHQRKLAGKIIVLKNDASARKEEKFVLVRVNVNTQKGDVIGSFSPAEHQNLYNSLHQAMIVPTVEETTLDLSCSPDFETGGKHLTGTNIKLSYPNSNGIEVKNINLYTDCKTAFENVKDASGVLINAKYNGFFTIFKFGINSNQYFALGAVQEIATHNVMMFTPLDGGDDCTLNHETLHGLGLCHTHRDTRPLHRKGYKYIYPNAGASLLQPIRNPRDSTDNVMCYRDVAYTTWHWQWKIINTNIN
jgi:type VI secretion system secreted protein VgrG